MAETKWEQLVLLDASVLEGRYLHPLLRCDPCRDIQSIIDHGYQPAVLQKTLGEIWGHIALGRGNSRSWSRGRVDCPESFDSAVAAIAESDHNTNARQTAWLWYNLSEEWLCRSERLHPASRQFLHWKGKMKRFCLEVEHALESAEVSIVSPWHCMSEPYELFSAASIEREVALNSLLPTEDSAWITDAVILGARAVVTSDKEVIHKRIQRTGDDGWFC